MSERNIHVEAKINEKKNGGLASEITASVHQSLFSPCMISVEMTIPRDEAESIIKNAVSEWLGGKLDLRVWDESRPGIEKKYEGTILSIVSNVNRIEVFAQSEDHLLGSARKYRSYTDLAVKDIVQDVVTRAGIQKIDITPPSDSLKFKFFHQYDETDRDFLIRLARYDGCVFYHDGEKFIYESQMGNRQKVTLDLGESESREIRLQCNLLPNKARGVPYNFARHADPKSLEIRSGSYTPLSNAFATKVNDKVKQVFQNVVADDFAEPIVEKNDFEAFLKHQQMLNGGRMVRITGQVDDPRVAVGRSVQCEAHPLLKDPAVVVALAATSNESSYSATFDAIPAKGIVQVGEPDLRRHMGLLQPAQVRDNKDPEKLGRVQIQYIWDLDGKALAWARLVQAGAGKQSGKSYGTHFIPRVGDHVLVGCIHGDPSLPIIFGGLYHSESKPDFLTDNGTEEVLVVRTPKESTIRVLDKKDAEEIVVSMRDNKNLIRLQLKEPKITIECVDGTVLVHSKTIQIKADEKIEMQAKEIDITAQNNMKTSVGENKTVSVGKDSTVSVGKKAEETIGTDKIVKAGKSVKASAGTNVEIEAGSGATIKAGANVKVESTQVESSASATNTIKGGLVIIN
jgi:type VI secretion system secreted protein VgrG